MTRTLPASSAAVTGSGTASKRILEPHERISEVVFGLIMVLTFTGSLSIAEAGREDIRMMLIGALGCNIAWGVIDGVLYLMGCLADKGRELVMLRALREADDVASAQALVADALPQSVASVLEPSELESISRRLREMPSPASAPTDWPRLSTRNWLGALGVFLVVFLTTFPVAIPFLIMHNAPRAMRTSNAVAVAMLFASGYAFGRTTGARAGAWVMGIAMVVIGLALVAITIALGG